MATIIINVGTYDKIEPFADTQISVVQNDPINKNQQLNLAEQKYVDTQINTYASNTVLQLSSESIGEYDLAIHLSSNLIFALWNKQIQDYADDSFTIVRPYYTDQIQLYSDDQINLYANQSIEDGYYQADFAIDSTTTISEIVLGTIFDIDSLSATTAVSTDAELVLQIGGATLISIASTESVSTDNEMLNRRFLDPTAIESEETIVDTIELQQNLSLDSITSTESFENDLEALLEIGGATLISVESGLDIGTLQIDRAFTVDTFFTQTQQFGEDVLVLYIGADGTNLVSVSSTTSFGTPVFSDFIHRSLIFKNDNITKVGVNDAVEIAGGIVINSSGKITTSATSGDYSVPSTAAGFILVTIDGINYKMPYYNE